MRSPIIPVMSPQRPRRKHSAPHPYTDADRGERLQRVLAAAGIDSRRHCEQLIEDGRVTVNGTVVDKLPAWVDATSDRIEVDHHPIRRVRPTERVRHHYIMLNKPAKVVSTNDDEFGRQRAIDLVDVPGKPRLFCVGRLDADSTGLLLLTTDGELANRLTHPRYEVHKTYELVVKGALEPADVKRLETGVMLHDRRDEHAHRTNAVSLKLKRRDRERTHLLMQLTEGRNRQIRRMMAVLGYPVKSLKRIQLGPLKLSRLARGQWRPLTPTELAQLRKAAGLSTKPDKDTKAKSNAKTGSTRKKRTTRQDG